MYELTINGEVYQFHFGMGFLREINSKIGARVDGLNDVKKYIGLRYHVSGLLSGEVESLVEILHAANKSQNPRLTVAKLDAFVEDENTDIDTVIAEVLDFLSNANVTKKVVTEMVEANKAEQAKLAAK